MAFETFIALTAISSVVGAIGSIAAGNAAAKAGKANAEMLRQQAAIREQQGLIAAERQRKQRDQMRGAQLAAYAAQGIDILAPSPMEIASETIKEYEWRAESVRWQGEAEAVQLRNQASLQKWQGQQTRNQYYAQAVGQLFGGASRIAGSFAAQPSTTAGTMNPGFATPGFTGPAGGGGFTSPPVQQNPLWTGYA